ncbi:MAG: leucine-rich repeat domain-containing protein [Clostridiales bacterium]|nr:leucine-rich repeat domain-containing protein [Clostridiales bacterium]
MKQTWKTIILCILAALLLAGSALADDGVLMLPEDLTIVEAEAFYGVAGASKVIVPEGVTSIGARAFAEGNFSEIRLPGTVTDIGDEAFRNCGKATNAVRIFWLPDGVNVNASAFEGCKADVYINGQLVPYFRYTVSDAGVTVTNVYGQPAEAVIPDTIEGKPVVAIGSNAFNGKSAMTRVVIPATVTSIGSGAFRDCSALTGVELPEGLVSLGDNVFRNCRALTEVTIPAGITALPASAFEGAQSLAQVHLPDTLAAIGNYAFYDCYALTEISIPSGIDAIAKGVFQNCTGLTNVQLPAGLQSIGENAFRYCTAMTGIDLPAGLTALGTCAFCDCRSLTEINLPAGITALPTQAFRGCSALADIGLPAGLTTLGDGVFYDCRALTEIDLPSGVTALPAEAFRGCYALTDVGLPAGFTTFGNYVFYDCKALAEISIPSGVTAIAKGVFQNCTALMDVQLPAGLQSIGESAFSNCSAMTGIDLPAGLTALGNYVFYSCTALTEIDLPAGITSLPEEAFRGCYALAEINLPDGLTSMGKSVFRDCRALAEITIPAGVTSIPESAFEEAWSLAQIHLPDTLTVINKFAFYRCKAMTAFITPSGVTEIPQGVFQNCTALQSVQLPAGLESIGQNAFRSCTVLTQINFPSGLTSIGQEAFRDTCVGQPDNTIYVLPDSVATFGTNAFYNCGAGLLVTKGSAMETFVKENGYTFAYNAGNGFRYQYKNSSGTYTLYLTGYKGAGGNVAIPAGPAVIGDSAFKDNTAITAVTIPDGVTKIDVWAFQNCTNLASATIADSVADIGDGAFKYCAALTDVVFPAGLQRIGSDAFDYACTAEGTHYYVLPDHVATLSWSPFSDCGAVLCFNRGSDTAALFQQNQYIYTYTGETDFRYRWYNNEEGSSEGHRERLVQYTGTTNTVAEIPPYVWLLDDDAFRGHSELTRVVIPEGVTRIHSNVFRDCASLTDVVFPDSLNRIYDRAFDGCGSAAQDAFLLRLPAGISQMGAYVFDNCQAILVCDLETTTAATISNRGYSFVRQDRDEELDIRYKYGYFNNNQWIWALYDYVGTEASVTLPDDCVNVLSDKLRQKVADGLELKCSQMSDTAAGLSRAGISFTFPGHEYLRYRIISNVLYIMGYTGTDTQIIIPAAQDYVDAGVDEQIRTGAFQGKETVTRVVIPEGVTRINDSSFSDCYLLTDITFPSTLKKIEQNAFRWCGRDAQETFYFTLPDNMEDLTGRGGGAQTFSDCNAILETGKFSETAKLLTNRNFCYTVAGEHDFRYRYRTETVDGETVYRLWLVGYAGNGGAVTIPQGIYGVMRYQWDAPYGSYEPGFVGREDITSLVIPEGTVVIADSAFRGAVNLVSITFPESLKVLENHAFEQCGKNAATLHYYVLPDDMTEISTNVDAGWGAFTDINMGRIVASPDTSTALQLSGIDTYSHGGSYRFALKGHQTDGLLYRYRQYSTSVQGQYENRLILEVYEGTGASVIIPSGTGLYGIESGVFQDRTSLQKVVIPDGMVWLGEDVANGCAVMHEGDPQNVENVIRLPGTLKTIGKRSFMELGAAYTAERFFLVLPGGLESFDISIVTNCNAVLVAPSGSVAAQVLHENWYYYYFTLEDAMAMTNVQYRRDYDEHGVEIPHVHYGRQ